MVVLPKMGVAVFDDLAATDGVIEGFAEDFSLAIALFFLGLLVFDEC